MGWFEAYTYAFTVAATYVLDNYQLTGQKVLDFISNSNNYWTNSIGWISS
jgi:hypothetical protein